MEKGYLMKLDENLLEAVATVARQRAVELSKKVTMKDIFVSCILSDRDIVSAYSKLRRKARNGP